MARLPKRYASFVYGTIQAAITTAVATAIATERTTELGLQFLEQWVPAWLMAFVTMLPVVVFVAPLIQRAVSALTTADPARQDEPGP
jgi:hypothetical protein